MYVINDPESAKIKVFDHYVKPFKNYLFIISKNYNKTVLNNMSVKLSIT
jgi:hypothetical protein